MSFIVAIDGPAGTGKGTITSLISKKFGFVNIDTGATYRCVTLEMMNKNIPLDDEDKIDAMLKTIKIEMKKDEKDDSRQLVFLNGEDVTDKIRTKEVTSLVSKVSENKNIRNEMATLQRKMAQGKDSIMEGRDIGTVVFPTADVKIYLDADVKERANRRFKQNQEKKIEMTYEEVLDSIEKRDKNDKEKEFGALKQAEDAIYVDTTNMTIKQVEDRISEIIKKKIKNIKKEERIYKERKRTWWKELVRKVIKGILHGFYVFLFRIKKINENNLNDMKEPVIVCANHLNLWDAVAVVCCSKKRIRFIGKEELFNNGFLNWIGHVFDVIPVKRGMRDMKSMKMCLRTIKDGETLGLFPEGTRKGIEKGEKVQNGAAYMALKTKVKVVPIGIVGSFKPFTKVYMNYGKPIDLSKYDSKMPEKDNLDSATKEIIDEIIMLTKNVK